MADLYQGHKLADAALVVGRKKWSLEQCEPMKYIPEAMDHMYRLMRNDMSKKYVVPFTLAPLKNMFLGASAGYTVAPNRTIPIDEDLPHPVKVSGKGKKIEHFEQYLDQVMEFLRTGKEPPVPWTLPPKNENAFPTDKQHSDEDWKKTTKKCRVFNIPSGVYIIMERLVSTFRHVMERGWAIRVGHKWSHGGADMIARCLGVKREDIWKKTIVEGDGKNFDAAVLESWVNLYFSTMSIYMDKSHEDYPIFEKIIKFLLKNMLKRFTRLFGDVWGMVSGGVPSGAYNTSHMDSWIMLMYFCLFCTYQIMTTSDLAIREKMEMEMIDVIRIIVYGDDHLYNKGDSDVAQYFSGVAFSAFMKQYFNMDVRDLKDGISLASKAEKGWITHWGATFLKHQMVENPYVDRPLQPFLLPYRESREFIVRAIWGRETRSRDEIDVLLSILGHAYGTYASNRDAYDRLHVIYSEIVSIINIENLPDRLMARISHDDLKKIRNIGIKPEDLVAGFPLWETLILKNQMDESYQDISKVPLDALDVLNISDVF
jgi:hypothetical protein